MIREQLTATNHFDLVHRKGHAPIPAVWTVRVWQRPEWLDYAVQAQELHTGALVPASGPRLNKTLHKARKKAARLFAVVTSALAFEEWPRY